MKTHKTTESVIVAGGQFSVHPEIQQRLARADLILAADRGATHLMDMDILPHYLMGDLDSIAPHVLAWIKKRKIPIISYPSKKDYTDTELCIQFAREKGATDITLTAATGTRFDHSLANVFLLEPLCTSGISARIMDAHNTVQILCGKGINNIKMAETRKEFVSVLAVSEVVTGLTITGLAYSLQNASLFRGSSLGISNRFQGSAAEISIETGTLLVFQSKD